jgi:hypothetical protein
MKLVALDAILNLMIVPEVLLTQFLTGRAAVARERRISLWVLFMSHI